MFSVPMRRLQIWMACLVALVAVWTNPGWNGDDGFRVFLRSKWRLGLGQRVAELFGLADVQIINLGVATIGWESSRMYLGAFDLWLRVPLFSIISFEWPESHDIDMLLCVFVLFRVLWHVWPRAMTYHFVCSWHNVRSRRIWVFLTAQLSHAEWLHLLTNALFLYSVAPIAHTLMPRRCFFGVYFLGGGCGMAISLVVQWLLSRPFTEHLGASGSLFAIMGYLSDSSTKTRWLALEWSWTQFLLLQLLIGCLTHAGSSSHVDLSAHLAGAAAGWAISELKVL